MILKLFRRKKQKVVVYVLLEEPINRGILGVWSKHLSYYSDIVGYSVTGAIFLHSPETNEYLIFYPSMSGNNSKSYGEFESLNEFEEKILKEESFHEYCLYPINLEDLTYLEKKLGILGEFQIYYPKLDPVLGGSLELDEFDKGDVWVRTDILGQNRGVT